MSAARMRSTEMGERVGDGARRADPGMGGGAGEGEEKDRD